MFPVFLRLISQVYQFEPLQGSQRHGQLHSVHTQLTMA